MNPIRNLVLIDGSVLEGGGQILRISVSLSAILKIPIKIEKIRAGRAKPGLLAQHLTGIKLVGEMCGAKLKGVDIGSTEVEFIPTHNIKQGTYYADIRTAGAISLLLQVALPCALFAEGQVDLQLRGGTNADMAPQIEYITEVFRPNLMKFCNDDVFDLTMNRRGYFPKGGGEVLVNISPKASLNAVNLTNPGNPMSIYGWSYVAGVLPIQIADEISNEAKTVLGKNFPILLRNNKIEIESYKESKEMAIHNGGGVVLVCETSTNCVYGGSAINDQKTKPFLTGRKAANEIVDTIKAEACVDKYTQDQLVIFMALANGVSEIRITEPTMHTKTAIYIVEKLTKAKFEITKSTNAYLNTYILKCTGIGHRKPT